MMIGQLIKSTYKYTNDNQVTLPTSGAKVNAYEVSCQEGKVISVPNGDVSIDGHNFNFSIYNSGLNGKKTYNLNSVPEGVDGQAIVREFVEYVEADILS